MVQMKLKTKADQLDVTLDAAADVLYVSTGWTGTVEGAGFLDGVQLDFELDTDTPCGVTVIGFSHYDWRQRLPELADVVAQHLSVPSSQALTDIQGALIAT